MLAQDYLLGCTNTVSESQNMLRLRSVWQKELKNQQATACVGLHACPGLPFGMHEHSEWIPEHASTPFSMTERIKKPASVACVGFYACPGFRSGMHEHSAWIPKHASTPFSMTERIKKPASVACVGFYACPGFRSGMHECNEWILKLFRMDSCLRRNDS